MLLYCAFIYLFNNIVICGMKEENQRIASEKYLLDESEAKLKNSQRKEIHQSSKSINATHKLKLAI